MADNVTLSTVTTAGVSAATDDVGGTHFQRVKIALGADGTFVGDVSSSNPMPVVNSAAVTVTGSVGISGPVTVTGSVTSAITGPVTVTGSVSATQSGNWSIMGPVTVTGSVGISGPVTVTGLVSAVGQVSIAGGTVAISGPVTVTGSVSAVGQVSVAGSVAVSQHTIQGAVSLAGGTTGISGPVTVTGAVSVLGSLSSSLTTLLGATVVSGATVSGTIGVAKRVDTQATVTEAANTATSLQTDEFGNLRVVAYPGDAQTSNGGGVTGIQVFIGNGTTVGTTVPASISGPMTVLGSVSLAGGTTGISGPVTVQGAVSVVGQVSVVGSVTVAQHTINGAVSLVGGTTGISGPVTVTGSVGISGPVTVTGAVSAVGQVSIAGGVQGVTAHGTVASGNPVLVGWQGLSADQTAVTTTGVTRAIATLLGKVVNHPYALPAQYTAYAAATAGLATTVAATAFASAGASTRWYLTSAQFINQGATVTRVILQDGTGAIYYTASLATSGGGVSATFPVPLRIAANQTVEIKLDTTGTTVYTNLQGYKAAE